MANYNLETARKLLRNFSDHQPLKEFNYKNLLDILETQTITPTVDEPTPIDYSTLVKVCHILLIIIGIIGLIGNTISFSVLLSSKELRHSGITIYLVSLAVADIFVLITAIFRYKAYYIFLNEQEFIKSKFLVDAYVEVYIEPIHYIALGASSFLTVGLTTERYLAIKYPMRIKRYCTGTVNLVCVTITIVVITALTIPIFFDYKVITINFLDLTIKQVSITEYGKNNRYRCVYHTLLIPIGWYILPWIYLFICNFLLIHNVKKSAMKVHSQLSNRNRPQMNNSNNLTVVLISLVLAYMICHLPNCVITLIQLVRFGGLQLCKPGTDETPDEPTSPLEAAQMFTEVLNIVNSSINFILYCCFGEKFRKQFLKLCCKRSRKVNSYSLKNQSSDKKTKE